VCEVRTHRTLFRADPKGRFVKRGAPAPSEKTNRKARRRGKRPPFVGAERLLSNRVSAQGAELAPEGIMGVASEGRADTPLSRATRRAGR
jgi:hypothetical protein